MHGTQNSQNVISIIRLIPLHVVNSLLHHLYSLRTHLYRLSCFGAILLGAQPLGVDLPHP